MYLFVSRFEHPEWFLEVLKDIYGNSFLPLPKLFFDEDIIGNDNLKKEYLIEILNKCILEARKMNKKEFLNFISNEIQDTFFKVSDKEDVEDEVGYKKYYLGTLDKLKEIIIDS
ncbi:hypothetical protein [Cellulophaga baltica]|uniref:hypothetical protein n=1 Tax=Cellulophaga baltica TaxID=76594 RepID=UPI0024957519|nr:hypothetical protein [Cellulophaga baltica]